jgi:hypothetical protein
LVGAQAELKRLGNEARGKVGRVGQRHRWRLTRSQAVRGAQPTTLSLLRRESVGFAKTLYPPYGQTRNKKPGAVSRPGTLREFQFHE